MKNTTVALALLSLASLALIPSVHAQSKDPAKAMATSESQQNLKAFPAAQPGFKRYVIHLPARKNEADFKVEIIAGKTMQVDCNRHWIIGNLKTATAEGWGYDYFTLESSGNVAATQMGCPANSRHEAFVQVQGDNFIQRYNSRLPLVIYAKEGFDIRYRTWSAAKKTKSAQEG